MSIHEDWKNPEAPKTGMSPAIKVLLIVSAIGGFMLLLCCGGFGLILWKAKDAINQIALTTDPEAIRSRTAEIVQIEIPPGFEPTRSFDMGLMRWAGYEKSPRDGSRLLLMELEGETTSDKALSEQRRAMEQMFEQPGNPFLASYEMPINITERTTRELTVRGDKVEFEFNKGTSSEGKVLRQAVGAFRTPRGVAVLNLIVPEESYDEPAVVGMIEAIRDPLVEVDSEEDPDTKSGADEKPEVDEKPEAVDEPDAIDEPPANSTSTDAAATKPD